MNRVALVGRLTRDPELRYSQGSQATAVCNFTLAVDRRKKDEPADFLNIVAFGNVGEICGKYLVKGRQVALDGRIQTQNYERKDGTKAVDFKIVAENIYFIGNRQDQAQPQAKVPAQQQQFQEEETDEDLPWE